MACHGAQFGEKHHGNQPDCIQCYMCYMPAAMSSDIPHTAETPSIDRTLIDVKTNLGVLDARSGDLADGTKLWQDAFRRAPGRSDIGINLARAYCAERHFDDARDSVMRVLEFNPDLGVAKTLLHELNSDPPKCSP
ncbi:MAG TPA: tetratricopeptide repeat protein [Candidatus Methylomirabilis sp.]|nr:tetratricopeptide repeat protein [Candidatus Methylomirabilis sp.]